LQKIRPADIDDVVLVDVDRGSVTTQYDDLELLPDDIVSLSAKGHLFGMFKKNMFVVGDMLVVAEFILLQAVYTFFGMVPFNTDSDYVLKSFSKISAIVCNCTG